MGWFYVYMFGCFSYLAHLTVIDGYGVCNSIMEFSKGIVLQGLRNIQIALERAIEVVLVFIQS